MAPFSLVLGAQLSPGLYKLRLWTVGAHISRLEKQLLAKPWQEARAGVQVKLLAGEGQVGGLFHRTQHGQQEPIDISHHLGRWRHRGADGAP